MALRLRRGTNAERLLITPAEGELIYTTDTKLLYVGDGSTAGGTLVTGSGGGGGASALDDLTDVFATGSADDSVLAYNAFTNSWGGVPITDLYDVQEVLNGSSLNTDIVGDDSTVLVNVGESKLGLANNTLNDLGEVSVASAPDTNTPITWDGFNWTDNNIVNASVWDNTTEILDNIARTAIVDIYSDGGQEILNHNSGHLTAPDATRLIDGTLRAAHFPGGVKTEAGFQGDVFSYDLQMTMIDADFKTMTAYTFNGDLKGSVVSDDSTVIIDGVAGEIVGPISTASAANFDSTVTIARNTTSDPTLSYHSTTHGAFGSAVINLINYGNTAVANEIGLTKFRGTPDAKLAAQDGDQLGAVSWAASDADGGSTGVAATIGAAVSAAPSSGSLTTDVYVYTRNGAISTYGEAMRWKADKSTVFGGPAQLVSLTTAERDALTGVNGMIIYNETTSKVQAYAGGSWVDLH